MKSLQTEFQQALRSPARGSQLKSPHANKKTRLTAGIFTSRNDVPAPQPAVLIPSAKPKVPSFGRFHEPPFLYIWWQLRHAIEALILFLINKKQQRHLEHIAHNAVVVYGAIIHHP